MAKSLKRTTLTDEVFLLLKEKILTGKLNQGERLKQDHICKELGVSSSPVREALNKLENEGWIQNIPHRGRVVREVNESEIEETYRVRRALETLAIEECIARVTPKDIKCLKDCVKQIEKKMKAKDIAGIVDSEIRFHTEIVKIAQNKTLLEFFSILIQRGRGFIIKKDFFEDQIFTRNLEQMIHAHQKITEAIEAKDTQKAQQLINQHVKVNINFFK